MLLLVLLLGGMGCEGLISFGGSKPPTSTVGAGGGAGEPQLRVPVQLAASTALGLRRLDTVEYVNTVRDLLGVDAAALSLPQASLVAGLSNNQHVQQVSRGDLESYIAAADTISTQALPALTLPQGCSAAAFTEACFDTWAPAFLERAMRVPTDAAPFKALFIGVKADEGSPEALRAVLQAVLVSPAFLYRFETPDGEGRLDGYALASRLSYLAWGSAPDAALLGAAKAGTLAQPEGRKVAMRRLLADPRAGGGLVHFIAEWLGTQHAQVSKKGADILAGLDAATLQSDLEAEQRAFVGEALLGQGGALSTLLTARWNYVSPNGARILGVPAVDTLTRVDLAGQPRRGILTQPLLVAAHAKESGYSAVQLGRFVRERLLCQTIPPPPPGTDTTLSGGSTVGQSFREKLNQKTANLPCSGCHTLMNPPGFAYLAYDPVGRYLAADPQGKPFEVSGTLLGLQQRDVGFTELTSMIDQIANGPDVTGCFAQRALERTFGRTFAREDAALFTSLRTQLMANQGQFSAFVEALVASPEFAAAGPRDP